MINKLSVWIGMVLLLAACSKSGNTTTTTGDVTLTTQQDSISYSIGMDIGSTFQKRGIEVENDIFFQGFKDGFAGNTILTEEEMTKVSKAYQMELRKKQMEKAKQDADDNKAKGEKFRETYAKDPNVVKLDDGILYKVLESGNGATPGPKDKVKVDYTGRFIDDTVFDSSVKRGQPATFGVTQVIRGWTEILQKMKVGDKWEVVIPSDLAYGDRGNQGIPPGSTLVFEIKLLAIQ